MVDVDVDKFDSLYLTLAYVDSSMAVCKMTFQLRNIHEETLRYALSMEMRKRERMNMHTV